MTVRSAVPQFDREKLKEAVWLLADYCRPEELGNVKLHKALYFADMLSFLTDGHPITGDEYLKQKFGPTARHLSSALRSLENEGLVKVEEREFYGFYKKAYVALRPFVGMRLSVQEQEVLRDVADFVRGHSARSISELSHNAAWEAAAMGEILPYFTALQLIPEEVTEDDIVWATEAVTAYASARPQ